jgi:hypothetical protein
MTVAARKAGTIALAVVVVVAGELVAAGGRAVACLLVVRTPAVAPCLAVALSSFLLNPEVRGLIQTPDGHAPWRSASPGHHL